MGIKGKKNSGNPDFYSNVIQVGDAKPTSWTIGNANFTLAKDETSTYTPKENQKLCVSSEFPWMVAFKDAAASDALKTYFNKVCPNGDGTKCAKADADLGKIKTVTINLANGDPT